MTHDPPPWARGDDDGPRLVAADEVERLSEEAARARLHFRGLERLRLDPEHARHELTDEQRALRMPSRGGRRWKAVAELDARVEAVQRQQETLRDQVAVLHARIAAAEQADTRRLAAWDEAGRPGERPEPEKTAIEDELARITDDIEALDQLIDETLSEKERHVERHRDKLVREAQADIDQARDRYLQAVRDLEQAREQLVDARHTQRWARYYPAEEASRDTILTPMLAGGLLEPVRRTLGSTSQLAFVNVAAALAADAGALRDGIPERDSSEPDIRRDAVWESTPEGASALNREKEKIIESLQPRNVHRAAWESDEGST